jgi:hypothetical protein
MKATLALLVLCAGLAAVEPIAAVECRLEPAPDAAAWASRGLPHLVIPRMPKAPVIDGQWTAEEWQGAEATGAFVVPVTGTNADPATRAWLGVDAQNLYVAVHCGLAAGVEPHAAVTNHDGDTFLDDSVELYVWPGSQSTNYHHFVVNSRAVAYDAIHQAEPLTGERRAFGKPGEWNPPYAKAVGRDKDGWVLELAIPLREIGIRPEGVQVVRFNLWRNSVPGATRFATWSPTPKVDGHLLRAHGFGILTFAAAKGEDVRIDSRADWGHAGVFGLNASLWTAISPQRPDIVFWLNLPASVLDDRPSLLTPTLTPILPGGADGTPVVLGDLRITSPEPTRLVLDGLAPGDYRLSLKVSGGLSLPAADGLIRARAANVPAPITGRVVFDDRDWRGADAVASTTNVETALTAEALLKTEFAKPVLLFDPTDDETITCLAEFKGKLYLGSCTQPSGTDTGSIYTYDPDLHLWQKVFQVNEQGLIRLEVYGDTLYIAGYDANDGGWDLGNIYLHDGTNWVERRTVPRAVHTYGLAVYKDRIYLSADIFDEGLVGDNSKSRVPLYGRVVSSGDRGLTWREEYRGATQGQDVGLLAVFKDQLVLNARGDLFVAAGQEWRALNPANASFLYVLEYAADTERLLLGTPFGLCYYDGARYWRSGFFSRGPMRGITRFGSDWVLAQYSTPNDVRHGPGGTHSYPSLKPQAGAGPGFWASLQVVPPEVLNRDATGQEIDWKELKFVPSSELPTCLLSHRGRLYIGTHPEGRVLVLPVAKEGALESAPRAVPSADACRLYWEAGTPPGTTVRFQVRSATTRETLADAAYLGPDGTPETFYEQSGSPVRTLPSGFFQYRAVLATQDSARTPYLKRVTLAVGEK